MLGDWRILVMPRRAGADLWKDQVTKDGEDLQLKQSQKTMGVQGSGEPGEEASIHSVY